ncbi:H+transporting two-sector ATPase B/B' subunit [Maridesulfovibrio hydrothermalis]|uniref:ATP synthase subunit b n=1 Tax=Maridesulfovibrio hydrothermalis AM13 = DSM 14728 TaxID=1121451 RepID=L0RGP9_9BACT|nr:H+transporting two-sector ATPase B/B' subunit [Maridesulfovibrio hydrothermalis]CCO24766.1 H+transporting two-sector ATPase B/B' subunit [Maridesulfovibrio hydrothermalis AM13 = DSM 14728]
MLLDWFTVFAQILNFFVLIVLLKLFLYGPIVEAMKQRKEHVAAEMRAVRQAGAKADELSAELKAKREELENRAAEVMAEIHAEAEKWRQQAMASARTEIDALREEWLAALSREKENAALNLRKRLMHEVAATASRIVQDLAGSDLEQQIVSGFIRKIKLEAQGINCGSREILVRTGFAHKGPHQEKLSAMLDELFPACNERLFSEDPKLGLGIELIAGDRKWEWNLASYIDELEQNILSEIRGD